MQSGHEPDTDRMLTPAQTIERLAISRRTLERYIERGWLEPLTLPSGHRRFLASSVSAVLESRAA